MASVQRTSNIPADLQSEQIVLANCLLQGSVAPLGDLAPEQFFSEAHRKILTALRALAEKHQPIDTVQLNRELTGTGVLPSELAALTDGVPSLTESSLAWYRDRLNTLHQERLTLRAGYELGQAVSATEIRERAAEIVEKAKPPAAAKKTKREYSVIPPAAWYGATQIYRQAMDRTCSASDNYHFAGFVTVVGSLLGKSVFYDDGGEELYPNLFTVIVGEAGWAKKDSALRRAVRFGRDLDNSLTMIYALASVEGFVDELVREQKDLQSKGYSPTPLRVLLRLSELRNLIAKAAQKGTGNIIPTICEAYDCPPTLKTPTRSHYAQADEPILSVFACTNPNWLRKVTVEDLEAGFGSRITFVVGDPKPLWPKKHKPKPEFLNPLLELVGKRLEQYKKAPRAFVLSPEAEQLWNQWVVPHDALRVENQTINLMAARDPTTCIKVALVHAALDGAERIEVHHLHAAIVFIEWLYEMRFPLFAGHGLSPAVEAQEKLLAIVEERGRVNYCDVLRLMRRYSNAEQLGRLLNALAVPGGPIRVETVGGSRPKRFIAWVGGT